MFPCTAEYTQFICVLSFYLLSRSDPPSGNLKIPELHLETGNERLHQFTSVTLLLQLMKECYSTAVVTTDLCLITPSLSSTEPSAEDSPEKLKAKVHEVWKL